MVTRRPLPISSPVGTLPFGLPSRPNKTQEILALIRRARARRMAEEVLEQERQGNQPIPSAAPRAGFVDPFGVSQGRMGQPTPKPDVTIPGFMEALRKISGTGFQIDDPSGGRIPRVYKQDPRTTLKALGGQALRTGVGLGELSERYMSRVGKPFSAGISAVEGVPGVSGGLFRPTPERQERAKRGQQTLRQAFTGEIGFPEAGRQLEQQQREKGGLEQFVTEFFDPVSLGTLGFPLARAPAAASAAAAGLKQAIRLPETARMIGFSHDPQTIERLSKIPGALKAMQIMRPGAIGDAKDPIYQMAVGMDVGREMVTNSAQVMATQVAKRGDVRQLFNIGSDRLAHARPGDILGRRSVEGRIFNEIAQFPEQFDLNPAQLGWLDNFRDVTRSIKQLMVDEGVKPDSFLDDTVQGRYFPGFFKMLDDLELAAQGNRGAMGRRPAYEHSRTYELLADAGKAGYRPGVNPMEDVQILYNSMYQQMLDKRLLDIIRPYGKTVTERMSSGIGKYLTSTRIRRDALVGLQKRLGTMVEFAAQPTTLPSGRAGVPRVSRGFSGRLELGQSDPALLERFDAILRKRLPRTRAAAIAALRKDLAVSVQEAKKNAENARLAVAKNRRQSQVKRHLGEVSFPMTAVSGRIFSPDDIIRLTDPEGALADLTTLSREQIAGLVKVMQPRTKGWLDGLNSSASALRTMQAGVDGGVGMIHGMPLLLTQPRSWATAQAKSLQYARQPEMMAQELDRHWGTVVDLVERNMWGGASSEFTESLQRGGLLQKLFGKVAGLGPDSNLNPAKLPLEVLNTFEGQFTAFLSLAKIYMWEGLKPSALRSGKGTVEALDELASHVSKMTGSVSMANLGIAPTLRKALGAMLFFAPRYRLATYGLMSDVLRGGLRGQLARDSLGKMMVGGLYMYAAISHRLGQPMQLDPSQSGFMKNRIADSMVGPGTAFLSMARFLANTIEQAAEESPASLIRVDQRDNVIQKFVRSQTGIWNRLGWDLISGKTFMGNPVPRSFPELFSKEGGRFVAQYLLPFWGAGFVDYPRAGIEAGAGDFGGWIAHAISFWEEAVELADQYSFAEGRGAYKDLNKLEQQRLRDAHPDVAAKFEQNNKFWESRATGLSVRVNEYRQRAETFRETAETEQVDSDGEFDTGSADGDQWRENYQRLGYKQAGFYDALEKEFPNVVEEFRKVKDDPEANIGDIAYGVYIAQVHAQTFEIQDPQNPNYGQYDFDARDQAEQKFISEWGQDNFDYVQERLRYSKTPRVLEYRDGREATKDYWRLYERLLDNAGRPDLKNDFVLYMRMDAEDAKEARREEPILEDVRRAQAKARELMKERNQQIDHFFVRFYGHKIRNSENEIIGKDSLRFTPVVFP